MATTVIQCPFAIPCLGAESLEGDFPIRNLSAEQPDVPVYDCFVYYAPRPPLGQPDAVLQVLAIASSVHSYEAACELANAIALERAGDGLNLIPAPIPVNTTQPNPDPSPGCPDVACATNQQCVNGQCTNIPIVNDFGPVGRNPRDPIAPVVIGDLTEDAACQDYEFFGAIPANGTEPMIWSVLDSLPPGLTINRSTGLITGAPTAAGSYTFNVRVESVDGGYAEKMFTIRVIDITTQTPLTSGQELQAYSQTIAQTGANPPVSWQITDGSLPPGLTLDETTGIISGTPNPLSAGTYNFTVSMQDEAS